ncbi:UBP12 [Symbiodinium pilosum]|uniref:ubiquitinyl hydrolase 1 n=1 Tax=Symbiodinium pilosum TaxID=2952 RepID=A0A812K247_SYMPI|nr:UBP12 [Symbiodinium pilosum]
MGTPEWGADAGGGPPSPEGHGGNSPPQRALMPSPRGMRGRGGPRRTSEASDLLETEAPETELYTKENLPPAAEHEIEFIVPHATSFPSGDKVRSPPLMVRNFRFRILCFPSGTSSAGGTAVSAFVEADPPEGLDPRWVFQGVKYQVVLVNWLDYRRSVLKSDTWSFSKDGIDRGWHDMVRTSELSQDTGWLGPRDSLCFRACVCVRQADSVQAGQDYNCRKETGYVGLMNHGATCYMNGLLQSLFHVGEFRRIVYSIECEKEEKEDAPMERAGDTDAEGDISLIQALQNVFYRLQTSEQAVNCKELMKSFGWDTTDAFTQHDAQELNRILCDRLEEQMKGTPMDGSIKRLFEGEMENYIECLDVDYTSKRRETFYDIQLNIKSEKGNDLQTIEESLKEFTADEMLDGDNLYEAEGYGKQRAKKGIRFVQFPPVLNLQLKRFHFDMERMDMVKLNSRFEFPRRLDLSKFAPGAGHYLLHSVVVHSGDVNSGHYYAYIRPNLDERWVKFDDDNVTPCSDFAAVEDNFGGSDPNATNYFDRSPSELKNFQWPSRPRIHNAYILVYIREDCAEDVLRIPDPMQVNSRMVERCNAEVRLQEQRRREKLELQTKIRINLILENDLCSMTGFWDYTSIPTGQSFKMNRDQFVKDLLLHAEELLQVNPAHLALFVLHFRSNPRQVRFEFMPQAKSLRSQIPPVTSPHYDSQDPCITVLCVAARGYAVGPPPLRWQNESAEPEELSRWDEQAIMLVVKYFCIQRRKLVTLGCYYMPQNEALITMVKSNWVMERLQRFLDSQEVAPLPPQLQSVEEDGVKLDSVWECWEEYTEREIQRRSAKKSAKTERLWCGDIIVWQQASPSPPEVAGEESSLQPGQVAPTYPVENVFDLLEHQVNSIEVQVTLVDRKQPLCIDGVVMNGHWGAYRPSTAQEGTREEKPEDIALSKSPAKFATAVTKELQMDLRWTQSHVTGIIAQAFDLKSVTTPASTSSPDNETFLWLFQSPPSNGEEPISTSIHSRSTLKDIQRYAPYVSPAGGKKPLNLHAVEMPFRPGADGLDSNFWAFGVRFFDSAVREVGSAICYVNVATGTVEDLLRAAEPHIEPDWKISGPLRAMEVIDGMATLWRPTDPLRTLNCYGKYNVLYHAVRIEADLDTASMSPEDRLVEVYHCDRSSQQAFGQPLFLPAAPGEKAGSFKTRCKERLGVPENEFKTWRLVRTGQRAGRQHLKDDDALDSESALDSRICLEHVHPNPSYARTSRYNKPLTIK